MIDGGIAIVIAIPLMFDWVILMAGSIFLWSFFGVGERERKNMSPYDDSLNDRRRNSNRYSDSADVRLGNSDGFCMCGSCPVDDSMMKTIGM